MIPEGGSEPLPDGGVLVADGPGVSLILSPHAGRLLGPASWRPLTPADQPALLRALVSQRGRAEEADGNAGRLVILCALLFVCLVTGLLVAYLLAFVALSATAWLALGARSAEPAETSVTFRTTVVLGPSTP